MHSGRVTISFDQADISSMRKRICLPILDGTPRRRRSRRVHLEFAKEENEVQVISATTSSVKVTATVLTDGIQVD